MNYTTVPFHTSAWISRLLPGWNTGHIAQSRARETLAETVGGEDPSAFHVQRNNKPSSSNTASPTRREDAGHVSSSLLPHKRGQSRPHQWRFIQSWTVEHEQGRWISNVIIIWERVYTSFLKFENNSPGTDTVLLRDLVRAWERELRWRRTHTDTHTQTHTQTHTHTHTHRTRHTRVCFHKVQPNVYK